MGVTPLGEAAGDRKSGNTQIFLEQQQLSLLDLWLNQTSVELRPMLCSKLTFRLCYNGIVKKPSP